jgi:filamentous hemagglutinin family protein
MYVGVPPSSGVRRFLLTTSAMPATRATLAGLVTVAALAAWPADAGPNGGTVVGGGASIQGQGSGSVTINQTTPSAIINWATFNIGKGETTTFNQPSSASVALNRVIGGQGPSFLDGTLTANGRVFIVNGDGILFGPNSSINTAGFLATTNNIRNEDFMAGRYNFNIPGNPSASIVNQGSITAASGGFAALVAPGVRNSGTITATLGAVSLAAGNAFTLDFYGDKLITLAVNDQIAAAVRDVQTGETLKSLVHNTGKLSANGGRVELTAAAARAVVDSVINNKGVIEANAIGTRNGRIVLSAATGASKPAGAPAQTVALSGQISAAGKDKGTKGGTVVVTGETVALAGVTIDVSGDTGGGKVLIGGDTGGGHPGAAAASIELAKLETFALPTATTVSVDAASVINASATGAGNGGKVVLWSDQQTTFAGTILAQAGASGGNGGFVETSSHGVLSFTGAADTRAANGSWGTLLLDPGDLRIQAGGTDSVTGGGGTFTGSDSQIISILTVATLQNALAGSNVLVQTGIGGVCATLCGNIQVSSSISWSSGSTLTLSAYRNISLNESATISNTGAGNLVLRADNTGTGLGTVQFFGGSNQVSLASGTTSIYYNPNCGSVCNKYQSPSDSTFAQHVTGKLTAYMLVNSAGDLQTMGTNLGTPNTMSGNYALGRNFSATGFTGFNIGAHFAGLLDGNGGLGVNYTISDLTLGGATGPIGLFPFIDSGATVRNVNLDHVTITASNDQIIIGTIAGQNNGTISNVNVLSLLGNSTINGGAHSGILAGGLTGQNVGTVTGSSANVAVTVGNAVDSTQLNIAGGLVGSNLGTITGSSATGNVSGGTFSFVGGLVGQNGLFCNCNGPTGPGTIASSFATGAVSVGSNGIAGGLLGTNNGGSPTSSSVTQSHATGNVSGSGNVQLGAFAGVNDTGATITSSDATGNVTGTNLVSGSGGSGDVAAVAGFAGKNGGTIANSHATGNVSVAGAVFGDFVAGAFVGVNNRSGLIQGTPAQGQFTYATGSVTGSANSVAAGFAGQNAGNIKFAYASGNVHVGSNSYAGGFVAGNTGTIFQAFATGTVTDDGNTVLGGFGAFNIGSLNQVFATGAVTGGTNTVVAGLVAVNGAVLGCGGCNGPAIGSIVDSYATGAASGGGNSIVAGLVAINDGIIKTSYAAGAVSGASVGGLVAQNNPSFQFADLAIPSIVNQGGSPSPLHPGSGAITNSYWNTQTSGQNSSAGGTGMTSKQLAQGLPAGFDPNVWIIQPDPSFPYFPWQTGNIPTVVLPPDTPTPPSNPNPPPQTQIIGNLTGNLTLVSLAPAVSVLPYPPSPPPVLGPQFVGEPRLFAIPPRGETRFVKDEVLLMVDCDTPQSALDAAAREMRLTIMGSQCLMQTHLNLVRLHINSGQTVAEVIRALARYRIIAVAQANFVYRLMQDQVAQDLAQDPDLAGHTQEGDSAQYALGKLGLFDIHRLIKGTNISIAVIDSQIDVHHPDLDGVFADQYDAVGGAEEKPHPHGTGMAGAIGAHRKLMGIAPAARLYAIHAFSSNAASADSTTFNILKGLDWAASKGVRVINMSFAGPRDPSMERALKNAHDKGIVLIAAAGNAGPKSPPLFPGADPNVIAVTATDSNDKIFTGANRGRYIAVAAPGVDILVPAPDSTYQLTTGTSVSSAEVAGIAALLLERNPNLTPEDIRKILTTSARHPGTKERDDDFGSGLVDPSKAIQNAGELKPPGQPARR